MSAGRRRGAPCALLRHESSAPTGAVWPGDARTPERSMEATVGVMSDHEGLQCSVPDSAPRRPRGAAAVLVGVVVAVVAGLVLVGVLRAWRRYSRFRRLELAIPGPASLPVLGNALAMVGVNTDNALERVLGLWGGRQDELSRFSILGHLIVVVSNPDHIAKVVRDRRLTDKSWIMYSAMSSWLGQGLVTSNGALWRRHRTFLQPAFHREVLDRFVDVFADEAAVLVDHLRPLVGAQLDCSDILYRTTAAAVLRTTLSVNMEDEDKHDIEVMVEVLQSALKQVNQRTLKPWLWPDALFRVTAMGREQERTKRVVRDIVDRLIKRKTADIMARRKSSIARLERNLGCFQERKAFLDMILEAVISGQIDFSREEIDDEIKTVFAAAIETSATTLTFVLKMLSVRPAIQDRVYAELCDVFQGSDRAVTCDDLLRLKYTERVIKETLRIFPTIPMTGRRVPEDTELCGKVIPAGSTLVINILGAHRDPRHHADPMTFDPDRFERTEHWHPNCYMPFSAGPRNCIGKMYSMMQMKTILATTLRAYRLLPAADGLTEPRDFPLTFDIKLSIVGGAQVLFEPRH